MSTNGYGMKTGGWVAVSAVSCMLLAIGLLSWSCGGGGGGGTSNYTDRPETVVARTGYVEGYIYAPETTAGKKGSVDPTPQEYGPLASATVEVKCGSVKKTGATDAEGYYKIEEVPVGDCTLTATKQGYSDIQRQISVAQNTGTTFAYTMDGRMLGRILLEDNTDHSGTTVSISYGDNKETVEADEKGIYFQGKPPARPVDGAEPKARTL